MDHPVALRGSHEPLDPIEAFRERVGVPAAVPDPALQLLELHESDGRRDFRHSEVVAQLDMFVLRRLAVVPQEPRPPSDLLVVRGD